MQPAWEEHKVDQLGLFLAIQGNRPVLGQVRLDKAKVVALALWGQDGWVKRCPRYLKMGGGGPCGALPPTTQLHLWWRGPTCISPFLHY